MKLFDENYFNTAIDVTAAFLLSMTLENRMYIMLQYYLTDIVI